MRFYILQHADNEFQIIGTRQHLKPLPTKADILAAQRDFDWTVEDEATACTTVVALYEGYNLHKKISETSSALYHLGVVTK